MYRHFLNATDSTAHQKAPACCGDLVASFEAAGFSLQPTIHSQLCNRAASVTEAGATTTTTTVATATTAAVAISLPSVLTAAPVPASTVAVTSRRGVKRTRDWMNRSTSGHSSHNRQTRTPSPRRAAPTLWLPLPPSPSTSTTITTTAATTTSSTAGTTTMAATAWRRPAALQPTLPADTSQAALAAAAASAVVMPSVLTRQQAFADDTMTRVVRRRRKPQHAAHDCVRVRLLDSPPPVAPKVAVSTTTAPLTVASTGSSSTPAPTPAPAAAAAPTHVPPQPPPAWPRATLATATVTRTSTTHTYTRLNIDMLVVGSPAAHQGIACSRHPGIRRSCGVVHRCAAAAAAANCFAGHTVISPKSHFHALVDHLYNDDPDVTGCLSSRTYHDQPLPQALNAFYAPSSAACS